MSIAVSAVVRPSRILSGLMLFLYLGVLGIAAVVALGIGIDLAPAVRLLLALPLFAAPIWAIRVLIKGGNSLRIDISEHGQITLAEDGTCAAVMQHDVSPQQAGAMRQEGVAMANLLPDSTLWPHLLLLRLRTEDGRTRNVVILPDSVRAEDFRALSVACRWIAAHNGQAKR